MAKYPSGGGSDAKYVFIQGSPAATWNITHGLGKFPSVVTVDSTKDVVIGEVVYIDTNSVEVKFGGSTTGAAYLN